MSKVIHIGLNLPLNTLTAMGSQVTVLLSGSGESLQKTDQGTPQSLKVSLRM